jgi:HEAT repeat protein
VLKYLLPTLLLSGYAVCQAQPSVTEQAHDILRSALQDSNPDVRKEATTALSLAGVREAFYLELPAMLADKDVQVRLAAVSSLSDLNGKRTLEALREALRSNVPEVSFAAAKALFGLNDPAGKEELLAVLSGEIRPASGFVTSQMRDAIRKMHMPRTMFMFALKSGIGFAPVPGLGEGISSMQGLLSDSSVSGRGTAALLLGREKDNETLRALREALSDGDWSVRAAAVHSLAVRNDPEVQHDLVPLFSDKKEAVRLRAAAAWLRLEVIKRRQAAAPKKAASP